MTATFQLARELGWEYFEKLSKQRVMQVQSSTDPPKKLALGERAVMADGNDYNLIQLKERGQRGGAWGYPRTYLRIAVRGRQAQGYRYINAGVRVAREIAR